MSAVPGSRRDFVQCSNWKSVPGTDSCTATKIRLFDDLVGAQQDRWGYGKAECRGGLAVHDHLEFCRKLHREIARLCAAQDAIDISGGATKDVCQVVSVGEQTAVSGKVRIVIDCRYVVPSRRQYDRRAVHVDE